MKKNKGITLVALMVSIIIIIIILGITVNVGINLNQKTHAGKLISYMELVKTRAEDYYEEIAFNLRKIPFDSDFAPEAFKNEYIYLYTWDNDKYYTEERFLEKIDSSYNDNAGIVGWDGVGIRPSYIRWDSDVLKRQGIDNKILEKDDSFFIVKLLYDRKNNGKNDGDEYYIKIYEIFYSKGIVINGKKYYSLTELKENLGK